MTPQDLKQIGELLDEKLDKVNSEIKVLKSNGQRVEKNLNDLVDNLTKWKSELFDNVDDLASEIRDSRDFRDITTHQIVENRERTNRLEKKVFGAVQV